MNRPEQLTLLEAASIVMGSGVGGGIMAVPFLADAGGFSSFILILLAAYAFNLLIHLMLVEVMLRDGGDNQIIELIRRYVFRGKIGLVLLQILFGVLLLSFLANLSAYLQGSSEILAELTGLSVVPARSILYLFSAAIVFFGLKNVGLFEKYALFGILILILIMAAGAVRLPFQISLSFFGGSKSALALYGMVMYSLYSFFAVPQAVKGLAPKGRAAVKAVILGTTFNAVLIFLITLITMGVSRPVTEIAIVGIGLAAGGFVRTAGFLFIILAMLTSFWSISLALADILRERTGTGHRLSWILATLPPLLLTFAGRLTFTEFLTIAAGIVALILVFITLPLYLRAKREGPVKAPEWSLGRWCNPVTYTLLVLGTVLMGLGSLAAI